MKYYQDKPGMFLLGDMNHLHAQQSCDPDLDSTLDILVNTLKAGPHPSGIHVN